MFRKCTFFGHRECPSDIEPVLRKTIEKLITREGVNWFYVGDSGDFDRMVLKVLDELKTYLYDIEIWVVLAYFPKNKPDRLTDIYSVLPDEIEKAPPRFAIDYRNNYMLKDSEFVVTYTVCNIGGAAKFENKARRQKKNVINIAELMNEQKQQNTAD